MLLVLEMQVNTHIISVISLDSTSIMYVTIIFALLLLVYLIIKRVSAIHIIINDVLLLNDGSYYLSWGYNNTTGVDVSVAPSESSILVDHGGVLLLSKQPPTYFLKGNHPKAMEMVALEGSEVTWFIKDSKKKIQVNQKVLEKGKEKI
ncbi:MAG: hypothetical protein GX845_03130 [Erysipelothrix sp.]|nr:hypothetical protein [Erysipelothrix sp.]